MFKKILFTLTIISLVSCVALPAAGQEIGNDAEVIKEYIDSKFDAAKIAILTTLGKNMIQRRINALSTGQNLLAKAHLVSEGVKNVINDEIEDTITNLTALKDSIDSEEDLEALKTKVESIVVNYRVYLVQLPKAHGLAVISHYRTISTKLDEIIEKLSDKVDELGLSDEGAIEDAKALISSASSKLNQAEDKFDEMQIEWPAQATTLNLEARELIIDAKGDLHEAFIKLKEAISNIQESAETEEDEE